MCKNVLKNFPVLYHKDHIWKLHRVKETDLVNSHKIDGGTTKVKDRMVLVGAMGKDGGVDTKMAKVKEEEEEDEISRAMEIKCGREGGVQKRTFPPSKGTAGPIGVPGFG